MSVQEEMVGLEPVWVLVPRDQDPKAGKSIGFFLANATALNGASQVA
jgi:hypothetical protein